MISLGKKIEIIRRLLDLGQQELADAIGITKQSICYYEKNQIIPRPKRAEDIEAALNVRLNEPRIEAAFAMLAGDPHWPDLARTALNGD